MRIRKELGNGMYEYEKIPDAYRSGKGYLYRNGKCSVKLYGITEEIESYTPQDFVQFSRLIKLCRLNYHGKQRLIYRYNALGDARDVGCKKIMEQLGLSKPTTYKFLDWCFEHDYLRKDEEYGSLIVNPEKIMLGSRISGREYWVYRDLLEDKIPPKYVRMLTMEAKDEILEEYEEEELE